jgi:hypothetical protein
MKGNDSMMLRLTEELSRMQAAKRSAKRKAKWSYFKWRIGTFFKNIF